MTSPRYAELTARVLRARLDGAGAEPSPAARDAAIEALRVALARKQRSASRRRVWSAAAGALAVAAAATGLWLVGTRATGPTRATTPVVTVAARTADVAPATSDVTVVAHPSGAGVSVIASDHVAQPLDEGRTLERGSRVVSGAGGEALLALSTGTSLRVHEKTDLAVVDRGREQRFRLGEGKVHASVAKLHDGERFLIDTTDAEVEVRGTAFDVSTVDASTCGQGARTRVVVTEGVVVVRRGGNETRVAAGQSWPADCATPVVATAARPATPARPPRSAIAPTAAIVPERDPSVLGAQNDLFAQGVAARRRGDASAAVETFDRFLARWPSSALSENATVERMRALRTLDATRGRDAARAYLAAYPAGFARTEAESALSAAP